MDSGNSQQQQHLSNTELMEKVATWLLKLDSSDCTEQDKIDFEAWQQQNPIHQEMVEQMQATFAPFNQLKQQPISHQVVIDAVQHSQTEKIFKSTKYYILLLLCVMAVSFWQVAVHQYWFADTRNQYYAWNQYILSDQSEIKVSGQTAYNIKFDQQQRRIELLEGNILVDIAKDAKRPFIISTKFADIQALGTRFIVQHHDDATILTMLHSSTEVKVTLHNGQIQRQKVDQGQQIMMNAQGILTTHEISIDLAEAAWQKQQLAIDLMPLDQVLAILQSYQKQTLKYDRQELKDIEVTAMLPLDGTGLSLLENSLPITVEQDIFGRTVIKKK